MESDIPPKQPNKVSMMINWSKVTFSTLMEEWKLLVISNRELIKLLDKMRRLIKLQELSKLINMLNNRNCPMIGMEIKKDKIGSKLSDIAKIIITCPLAIVDCLSFI